MCAELRSELCNGRFRTRKQVWKGIRVFEWVSRGDPATILRRFYAATILRCDDPVTARLLAIQRPPGSFGLKLLNAADRFRAEPEQFGDRTSVVALAGGTNAY